MFLNYLSNALFILSIHSKALVLDDFPIGYPNLEWFHVDNSHFWVYGCFLDYRNRSIRGVSLSDMYVRFYAIGPYNHNNFMSSIIDSYCEYSLPTFPYQKVSVSTIQPPNFDWRNPRSQSIHFYIYCNLTYTMNYPGGDFPSSVSIVSRNALQEKWYEDFEGRMRKFLFPIRRFDLLNFNRSSLQLDEFLFPHKLAICVKPFYGNWASFKKHSSGYFEPKEALINFIIFYIAAGVEHFIFYDQGTAIAPIHNILMAFKSEYNVSIEILPWNFREQYGYGMFQTLSIESCIHRCLGIFENVIVVSEGDLRRVYCDVVIRVHSNDAALSAPCCWLESLLLSIRLL